MPDGIIWFTVIKQYRQQSSSCREVFWTKTLGLPFGTNCVGTLQSRSSTSMAYVYFGFVLTAFLSLVNGEYISSKNYFLSIPAEMLRGIQQGRAGRGWRTAGTCANICLIIIMYVWLSTCAVSIALGSYCFAYVKYSQRT